MHLSKLLKIINIKSIFNFNNDRYFSSITSNSQFTNKNTIFIYDKNSQVRIEYLNEAIKNKIPAIITNKYLKSLSIPQFLVSDINIEKESILKKIYKNLPHESIAITGTNGKTSVVWYISKILQTLKYNNTTVGTLGFYKNRKKIGDINLTTPAYEELYKYGDSKNIKDNTYIFEASSHALEQNRIRNYPINIAAITNISNDHLDYHKSLSQYRKAKLNLFTKHLSKNGIAIINSKLKNSSQLGQQLLNNKKKVIYFGKKYIYFKKLLNNILLKINGKEYIIKKLNLSTKLELENLECAIACCLALNISEKSLVKTLPKITNPPGRLQFIKYNKKNSKIVIDYAHTPAALEKILISLKKNNKKPSLLFGCGGERDKNKRKSMGIIANKFANRIYVTDDNPRNENPSEIRKKILKFCPSAIEIPNRKKAIKKAINDIRSNEILIIAGKGHEKVQIINNKKIIFNDLNIVKEIINK